MTLCMIVNIGVGLSKWEETCGMSPDSKAQAVTAQLFTPPPLYLPLPAFRLVPYGSTKYEEIKRNLVDSQAHAVPAQIFMRSHATPQSRRLTSPPYGLLALKEVHKKQHRF